MKKLTNGLVAKLMDEFIADIYDEIESEWLAEWVMEFWLAYGVPDGDDYMDCVENFGEQEDFDELEKNFIKILKQCKIDLYTFRDYAQEKIREDFLEMCDKTLDFTL